MDNYFGLIYSFINFLDYIASFPQPWKLLPHASVSPEQCYHHRAKNKLERDVEPDKKADIILNFTSIF